MTQPKPTLRSVYAMNFTIITSTIIEFKSLLDTYKVFPIWASLGMMLLSMILVISIPILALSMFVLSLLFLAEVIVISLIGMVSNAGLPGWNAQYILQLFTNIPSILKKWRKADEDSMLGSAFLYSEMPGGLDEVIKSQKGIQTKEQFDSIRKEL